MKHFLLIEDHEIMRMGIRMILNVHYPSCVIDEAEDEESAMGLLKDKTYDVVLSDVQMPCSDIFRLLASIKKESPDTRVLILSMSPENIYAKKLLRAGAHGFVSKEAGADELLKAIHQVVAGKKYVSSQMIESLSLETGKEVDNPFQLLTAREFEICRMLMDGESITRISGKLNISTSTAGTHKARILSKLKVKSIFGLIDLGKHYKML